MCFYKTIVNYKENYIYLWQENDDRDSFFVENGMILRFTLEEDYQEYINENRLDVIDEDTIIHIMPKKSLLNLKDKDILRFCNEMLNVWNLAIDIKNSFIDKITILDGNKKLYDKLLREKQEASHLGAGKGPDSANRDYHERWQIQW